MEEDSQELGITNYDMGPCQGSRSLIVHRVCRKCTNTNVLAEFRELFPICLLTYNVLFPKNNAQGLVLASCLDKELISRQGSCSCWIHFPSLSPHVSPFHCHNVLSRIVEKLLYNRRVLSSSYSDPKTTKSENLFVPILHTQSYTDMLQYVPHANI